MDTGNYTRQSFLRILLLGEMAESSGKWMCVWEYITEPKLKSVIGSSFHGVKAYPNEKRQYSVNYRIRYTAFYAVEG